jgi:hypothetical protein
MVTLLAVVFDASAVIKCGAGRGGDLRGAGDGPVRNLTSFGVSDVVIAIVTRTRRLNADRYTCVTPSP